MKDHWHCCILALIVISGYEWLLAADVDTICRLWREVMVVEQQQQAAKVFAQTAPSLREQWRQHDTQLCLLAKQQNVRRSIERMQTLIHDREITVRSAVAVPSQDKQDAQIMYKTVQYELEANTKQLSMLLMILRRISNVYLTGLTVKHTDDDQFAIALRVQYLTLSQEVVHVCSNEKAL